MNGFLFFIQQIIIAQLHDKVGKVSIYTHPTPDSKFPYIHIAKIATLDASAKTNQLFKVNVDIDVYSKDSNYRTLFMITELTMQNLNLSQAVKSAKFNCKIISSKLDSCDIKRQKDINIANLKFCYLVSEV